MTLPYAVRMHTESGDHYIFLITADSPAAAAEQAAFRIGEELAYVCDFDVAVADVNDRGMFLTLFQAAVDDAYEEEA